MIHSGYLRQGIPVYKLVDNDEEAIKGTFYQSELRRVGREDAFKVDKIRKRHKSRVSLKFLCLGWVTQKSSTAG